MAPDPREPTTERNAINSPFLPTATLALTALLTMGSYGRVSAQSASCADAPPIDLPAAIFDLDWSGSDSLWFRFDAPLVRQGDPYQQTARRNSRW